MRAVILALVLGGCLHGPILIGDARIEGFYLVVDRCEVNGFRRCTTERLPLPVVSPRPVTATLAAGDEAIAHELDARRDALANCATATGAHDVVRVDASVSSDGHITDVVTDPAIDGLAACIVHAFGPARFPSTSARVAFAFRAPGAAP